MTDYCETNDHYCAGLYEDLLPKVQKPARYIGHEVNLLRKNPSAVKLRMALAFPDVYEVGMSHLGLKILYGIVNNRPDLAAERVFAPWPDMEVLLRKEGLPLCSLESQTPLSKFDIVGFSLQYELCATTVLQMLDLGRIPIRAEDRTLADPFVIGGGPVAFNPAPLAPFLDAFVIGDGEEAILELADSFLRWKSERGSREELLQEWKRLPGLYVPAFHTRGEIVSRRILADLEHAAYPTSLLVPYCETVHDRIGLEIARGCTRGCRFCQAGMLYRPVRERQGATVRRLARESLEMTGWEEVALLSLSSGDYSCVGELIRLLARELGPDMVALSLPSLRTDTFEARIAEEIKKVRKTGFTLAPEAGTERLRRVINKGNTEEDLQRAVSAAFAAGWQSVKLYFMLGLPGETDEDLDGVVDLIQKAARWARGGKITAAISTFVPKAHTPFQWAHQISMDETRRRQDYIRRWFHKGRARVKFHRAKTSFLEGILARGDGRLSGVIETAFRKGARFDGWDEHLRFDDWMGAFEGVGINPEEYLRQRDLSEALPWSFIDSGVSNEYLSREWERALSQETTADCRFGNCQDCGVCDFERIYPRLAEPITVELQRSTECKADQSPGSTRHFRLRYSKRGLTRFLGHRDVVRAFHRAFRRAGMKLSYSSGFHPHPKMRFSFPLSLGIESVAEYVDFDLSDSHQDVETILKTVEKSLPEGFKPIELNEIALNDPPVSSKIQRVTYEIRSFGSLAPDDLRRKVREFQSSPTFAVTVERKGKNRSADLKELVEDVDFSGSALRIRLKSDSSGPMNALVVTSAILGVSKDEVRSMHMLKTSVTLGEPSAACEESLYEQ